jgi:uncharacterized protein YjbI with pentapeptide repeats
MLVTAPGSRLRILNDPLYQLLREGKIGEFNARKPAGAKLDFTNADFRNLELRGMDARGIDFSGSYFRQADLRGIDFRESRLEGVSINGAKISGVYFPAELSPEEITLSLLHGTRMRYSNR